VPQNRQFLDPLAIELMSAEQRLGISAPPDMNGRKLGDDVTSANDGVALAAMLDAVEEVGETL
jgi:hypothetical protein